MTDKTKGDDKQGGEKRKKLLDPDQPRVSVTDTGGEYAGRHPTPSEDGPDIVQPGGATTSNETTRAQ